MDDGPSFSVLLFVNRPDLPDDAGRDEDGFAGEFTVFAHGDCWGDVGHCDVPQERLHEFDRRAPHPLTPYNVTVEITEALRALEGADQLSVTALASATDPDRENVLRFKRLTLVTYD